MVLGSERLYNDMQRKFGTGPDAITVTKLAKSGGCVDRDEAYLKRRRLALLRTYFFGQPGLRMTLSPSSYWLDFSVLHVYRVIEGAFYREDGGVCLMDLEC